MIRALLFCLVVSQQGIALQTAYVKFDHPEGWKCELAEGVWICQSTLDPDRKESLVMSIAALASEWDSIENFDDYLKQARVIKNDAEESLTSEVSYTRRRNLNGHVWIDSLQHNSELPGFWTRYLATVNQKLAILITYIVSDEHYSKLAPQFERMVVSLTLMNDSGGGSPSVQGDGALPGPERLGPSNELLKSRLNVKRESIAPPKTSFGIPLVVLGVAVGFLFWRRKVARQALKRSTASDANARPQPPSQPR